MRYVREKIFKICEYLLYLSILQPPKFKDLPWPTIDLEENHHEAVSTLLFTVTATDTTKLDCYLSEPKNAPGIIGVLDQSAAPPDTGISMG